MSIRTYQDHEGGWFWRTDEPVEEHRLSGPWPTESIAREAGLAIKHKWVFIDISDELEKED